MTVRFGTLARAVLGPCAGAIVGVVVVFLIAGASASAIGNDGGAVLGMVLVIQGGPIAGIVGAIFGGWGAAAGPSSLVFKIVAGTAAALVALAVVLGFALPDNRPKPEVDVKGCTISLRDGMLSASGDPRYVVVYDRYCHGGEGHTVNVSVLASLHDRVEGPGNALVVAGSSSLEATSATREIDVFAAFRDSLHLEILYDYRAHVLSQVSAVEGFEVILRPELGLPRQANQPPAWSAHTPPIVASMPVRPARDSVMPYRPSAPGPLDRTDADGCTIRPRLTLDRYDRHIAVYDRDCATTPHRTINVALLAPDAALQGSGNVMVLSIDRAPEAVLTGAEIPVTVTLPDARHMEVLYDRRFQVIGQGFPGDSLQTTVRPRPQSAP